MSNNFSRPCQLQHVVSFTDFKLPQRSNPNEWQLAEKVIKLLESVQWITKDLSARRSVISEVIPFLETLKTEVEEESSSDTQEKFRGVLSTKEELRIGVSSVTM